MLKGSQRPFSPIPWPIVQPPAITRGSESVKENCLLDLQHEDVHKGMVVQGQPLQDVIFHLVNHLQLQQQKSSLFDKTLHLIHNI